MMMIDFENKNHMKRFLKRDKHNLLEGLCVEEIFRNDIIKANEWEEITSTGWWAIEHPNKENSYMFFHLTSGNEHPSDFNFKIYNILQKIGATVIHVKLENNNLYFLEINQPASIQVLNSSTYEHEYSFLSRYKLIKTKKVNLAKDGRNNFIQERAITFFDQYNILNRISLDRYFANYFLTVNFEGYPINIDYFFDSNEGLSIFEIKFKYPFKDKKTQDYFYGINIGQAKLFKWFLEKNIHVFHFIAKNPIKKTYAGIFEVLTSSIAKQHFYWTYSKLNIKTLSGNVHIAPKKTSINAKKEAKYIPIPLSNFSNYQIINGVDLLVGNNLKNDLIDKKSCEVCGKELTVKNGQFGFYIKCCGLQPKE